MGSKSELGPSARAGQGEPCWDEGTSGLEKIISILLVPPLGLVQEAIISSDVHSICSLLECLLNR